jgi:predicted nuclease of restriction endonuclease-like (RecB) superfamily
MRIFFVTYSTNENLQLLVAEISWTKNVKINNLENKAYEKYLLNQTNFDETVPDKYRLQAKLAVKDEYTFDFLEMGLEHSEQELELGLINNVRAFLSEMGGKFTFIGSQYYLNLDGEDFYIDLFILAEFQMIAA